PADPLDRGLHRPGLGRPRDARALERREPPDHDLSGHEDRPALLRAAQRAGRVALRQRRPRLEVPGPEGPDALAVLAELRSGRREVTVLVTGGTGFVGSGIVHALRAEDRAVRCLVRDARKASRLASWGCELVAGDVTDAASLRRAVEGCDRVIHLVAIRSGPRRDFERIMEQGTRDLVAASREAGVARFVLMSALGTTEETKDLVPYYHAKWEMERAVQGSGLEHLIFRPSFVFGRNGGILPTFRKLAKLSPVTPIIGSGEQRIQPIWVDDVAAYFAAAVTRAETVHNRTFEIGGQEIVSWNAFWEKLREAVSVVGTHTI